jgi:hypothetical protein
MIAKCCDARSGSKATVQQQQQQQQQQQAAWFATPDATHAHVSLTLN